MSGMGKLNKSEQGLPTLAIRTRAWAREISKRLYPESEGCRPFSHKIYGGLLRHADEITSHIVKMHVLSTLQDKSIPSSSGRWHSWWTGESKPVTKTVNLVNMILPGTSEYFVTELHKSMSTPFSRLLYAVDLFEEVGRLDNLVNAQEFLIRMAELWNPKPHLIFADGDPNPSIDGWQMSTPHGAIEIIYKPYESFGYSVLEPASIVRTMLSITDHVVLDETMRMERACDIVSASLATKVILNHQDRDGAGFMRIGSYADLQLVIYKLAISRRFMNLSRYINRVLEYSDWKGLADSEISLILKQSEAFDVTGDLSSKLASVMGDFDTFVGRFGLEPSHIKTAIEKCRPQGELREKV